MDSNPAKVHQAVKRYSNGTYEDLETDNYQSPWRFIRLSLLSSELKL